MESDFVVEAARLWNGIDATLFEDGALWVSAGRIFAVGPASTLAYPEGTPVLDFPNSTLMPGLIDCHTHLNFRGDGSSIEAMMEDPDELLMVIGAENLQRALKSGVTTLCDNGGRGQTPLFLRTALERGYITGPRILISGRPITVTHGHCWLLGGEADGEVAVRAAVQQLVAEGVDWIKIMASGGGTKGTISHRPAYSARELKAIIDEAHLAGCWVGAHCNSIPALYDLLETGVDMLIHGNFNGLDGNYFYDDELATAIAKTETWFNPTLHVCRGRIRQLEAQRDAQGLTVDEDALLTRQYAYWHQLSDTFAHLLEKGTRFAAGSDAGWSHFAFGNFWQEIDAQVACGMSHVDALRSATSWNAHAVGLEEETGTLEAGKAADLLLVDGNPLEDLSALTQVRAVYLQGKRVV